MVSAIVVAAGASRRMGFDKLFAPLAGRPVLWHSLRAFCESRDVDEVIVVTRPERVEEIRAMAVESGWDKLRQALPGGAERHLSVWAGLQTIAGTGSEFVAIHDGARPLVTARVIADCLQGAREHGAACCAQPVPDTVKRASAGPFVSESVDRDGLWTMQTPQVFASGLILQAYAALIARHELVTDEVSAVQKLGKRIALLSSEDWNFKITYPRDLEMAEQVLSLRARKQASANVLLPS